MTEFKPDVASRLSIFFKSLHNKRITAEPKGDSLLIHSQAKLLLTLESQAPVPITQSKTLSFKAQNQCYKICLKSNMGNYLNTSGLALLSAELVPKLDKPLASHLVQTLSKQSLSMDSQLHFSESENIMLRKKSDNLLGEMEMLRAKREEEKQVFFQKTCLLLNEKKRKIRELSENAMELAEENERLRKEMAAMTQKMLERPKKKVKRGSGKKGKKQK